MPHGSDILLSLFIVFVAAQVGAEIAQRLKLPGVVGEIAVGCVIGPSVLGWVQPSAALDVLAEIGVVLLLFSVGLETRLDEMKRLGRSAFAVGVLGVIVPFAFGSLWAHGSGFDWAKSLFVAAAFVATSAGITARVLQELGALQREESRVILGAAVIDDILAMLLLGIVTALQSGAELRLSHLLVVLGEAVGFVVVIGFVGARVMRRASNLLEAPINPLSPFTIVLALCLGLAFLSTEFGLAAIIGAFLAGMIASETRQREALEHQTQPLLALMTPFFFVMTGTKVELAQLANADALLALTLITVIAIASKLIGGFLGALPLGKRGALIVGIGMIPRGEVGVVVASLGLAAGVFPPRIYALIVAMSLLTSIVTPPALAILLREKSRPVPPG
ncbi:MAG: cation:proton antiporter [Xanthomonadaceae bacterium]|nr:cation:proton antiporter [Xanthomonadaceae bacterium]MDE1960772.1 cation:proton antiporter [Xanthomonadaceae bacterium]MDE2084485.1 cation:proton antiporter [Xanthomonadaceae bacterium]MDE2257725.1 cation:proton antiporter [Xanthomonadaceae bacterium]